MSDDMIIISRDDARIVFDLAVNADNACSGYMMLDDVKAMRRLAVALGVDPAECTGIEFVTQFPHRYNGGHPSISSYRQSVMETRADTDHAVNITVNRPETDSEVLARLGGAIPETCQAGGYGRCGKPANDPIHAVPA